MLGADDKCPNKMHGGGKQSAARSKPKRTPYQHRHGHGGKTPAQDQVAAFIQQETKRDGIPPSIEAIRQHMGWQLQSSVVDCLRRIAFREVELQKETSCR